MNGNAVARRAIQDVFINDKRFVESAYQSLGNYLNIQAGVNLRDHRCEFVAAQARQPVGAAQLQLHALRSFLKIKVTDVVAINIVNRLEFIEVDVGDPAWQLRKNW